MNHNCEGDFFKISDTEQYWRCLADGTCVPMALPVPDQCPNCRRPIKNRGSGPAPMARSRSFVATQAWIDPFGWIDVKWEEIKKPAA